MSTVEILSDQENKALGRRELVLNFKGGSGFISRQGATDAITAKANVPKGNVKLISLHGKFGVRDLEALAYVYSDAETIKRQLPKYMMLRELSKEERKKIKEAAKAKPPPPAEKK